MKKVQKKKVTKSKKLVKRVVKKVVASAKKVESKVKVSDKVGIGSDVLYVTFVLDETGSMQLCKRATISGFNEYVKTLGTKAKNVVLTLVKFNATKVEMVYRVKKASDVPLLTEETYTPSEMTPLYDAIAKAVSDTEKSCNGSDVLFIIMTDGEENASKEYTKEKVLSLIGERKAKGWAFVYLGANQDSWEVAQSIGIKQGNAVNYSVKNMQATFGFMADSTVAYASMSHGMRGMSMASDSILQDKAEVEMKLTNEKGDRS